MTVYSTQTQQERSAAIDASVQALSGGGLVVLPTDTVYGLGADAFNEFAVQSLLDAKGRDRQMPPPVLFSKIEVLDALAVDVSAPARKLAEAFWPGGLTIIFRAQPSLAWDLGETRGTVALRIPDHPVTLQLLQRTGPLAVSSANKTGQPPAVSVAQAQEQLGDAVRVYLDGGQAQLGLPSTIIDATLSELRVVRFGALSLADLQDVVPEIKASS